MLWWGHFSGSMTELCRAPRLEQIPMGSLLGTGLDKRTRPAVWGIRVCTTAAQQGCGDREFFGTHSGVLSLQHSTTQLLILQPLNYVHSRDWLTGSCLLVKLFGETGWSVGGICLHREVREIQLRNGECYWLSFSLFGSRPEVGIVVLYKFPPEYEKKNSTQSPRWRLSLVFLTECRNAFVYSGKLRTE